MIRPLPSQEGNGRWEPTETISQEIGSLLYLRKGDVLDGVCTESEWRTRNREVAQANLRQYRGLKLTKRRRSIHRMRYPLQLMDMVRFDGKDSLVSGTNNKGKMIVLKGCARAPSVKKVKVVKYGKGFGRLAGEDLRVSSPI
ncbi:hypothetical protein [Aneurinibacillus tyrosinisolvens]|uniref:hypothetical protein n=1 Tax=Aneurinibacillus tyrosinisolvens TaxID=1443435 RepID=UPI00063F0276|nr:hypothetical protein [Aneurinibacillus tyrosinisolvens]